MKLYQKILIVVGAILILTCLTVLVYKLVEMSKRQTAIEENVINQKQLAENITRSMSEFTTKTDLNNFAKDHSVNLKVIQDDLNKLHAEIKAINIVTISSTGDKKDNVGSTYVGPVNPNPIKIPTVTCPDGHNITCPDQDKFNVYKERKNKSLYETFGSNQVPIGDVGFSGWQEQPWNYEIFPRTYSVDTVIGVDEEQRHIVYNKFVVNVKGKDYELQVNTANTKEIYPEAKFSFWNPRLFIGSSVGYGVQYKSPEITPDVSVGFMSYGKYNKQPDISVLQVGVGFGAISQKPQLTFMPVSYNIGKHIPLMNNLYIGLSASMDSSGSYSFYLSLKAGL